MLVFRPQSSCRHRRRGFTMIELLLVIGIILVLVSLLFVGGNYALNNARKNDTKVALQTTQALFNEYDQATHLARVPGIPSSTTSPFTAMSTAYTATPPYSLNDLWTADFLDLANPAVFTPASATPTLGALSPDALQLANPSHPTLPAAVQVTEIVMQALLVLPQNQTAINSLPTGKKVIDMATNVPLLLDGWGNVIVFVPPGGLRHVMIGGQTLVGTTNGAAGTTNSTIVTISSTAETPDANETYSPAPGDRPFFASAGPDGILGTGDDNIYSFQN